MGISRACASKWVKRWRLHGNAGLQDRPSSPHRSPIATPAWVIAQIESWRREHKWSTQRITDELVRVCDQPANRQPTPDLGLGTRLFIDPGGENNRRPGKTTARWPGRLCKDDPCEVKNPKRRCHVAEHMGI
jgi:hypothetical protein